MQTSTFIYLNIYFTKEPRKETFECLEQQSKSIKKRGRRGPLRVSSSNYKFFMSYNTVSNIRLINTAMVNLYNISTRAESCDIHHNEVNRRERMVSKLHAVFDLKLQSLSESTLILMNLWMKSHLFNRRECLNLAFCEANEAAASKGIWSWALTEVSK